MNEQIKQIAERLRGLRDVLDLTPEEVAESCQMSLEAYLEMESGNKDISVSALQQIARKYDVSLDVLMFGEEPKMSSYFLTRKGAGVSVERTGLKWLWVMALLLMGIRQRFFCFAYAGGLLAVLHSITGWPDIEIGQLLALAAVLHATEGLLVWLSGHYHALPVYLKEPDGTITGGFFLQMTWPLPLIMLFQLLLVTGIFVVKSYV